MRITKTISDNGDITLTTFDATGKPVLTKSADRALSQTYNDGNGSEVKRTAITANGEGVNYFV